MDVFFLKPDRVLKDYIRHYVYCEIGADGSWTQSSMAPPGCAKLSITLRKDNISVKENTHKASTYEPIIFVGQTTRFKHLAWRDRLHLFLVIFRPYGAYSLLNIPQTACKNKCIGLSNMLGSSVSSLEEQLAEKQDIEGIREAVNSFFQKRLTRLKEKNKIKKLSHAVKKIKLSSGNPSSIKKICRQTGYSLSTLERHMKKIVGITPKEFQRIMRFNQALRYINKNPLHLNWPRIACRFGYYDQTHFIKEFKHFYGKTPAKYTTEDDRFLSNVTLQKKKLVNA